MAAGLIPLLAVMVTAVVPVAVGVPESRAVPLPLSVKVSPAGSVPGLGDAPASASRWR